MSAPTTITVSSQAQLNTAIEDVDQAGSGPFSIVFSGNITEGASAGLYALDLGTSVTATIDGGGNTLNGAGKGCGLD